MAVFTSAQDCLNAALTWAGELPNVATLPTDSPSSEFRTVGMDYLNRAYLAIVSGSNEFDVDLNESWLWARPSNPGVITLQPQITTGVTITQQSTTGTFGSIPTDPVGNNISVVGCYVKVDGQADYMIVTAHTAGTTSFTIDEPWTGTTTNGTSSIIYFLDYPTVSNIIRLIAPMRIYRYQGNPSIVGAQSGGELLGSDYAAMLREYPLHAIATYIPNRFAVKNFDTTTNTYTIRMNAQTPGQARVEYDYIPYPTLLTDSSSSIPIVPLTHRVCLAYCTAYFILMDKFDERAQQYLQLLQASLKSMKRADETQRQAINPFRARLVPRRDLTKRYRFWAGF